MKKIIYFSILVLFCASQSFGQQIHQAAWQQQVDVRLDVELYDSLKTVTGTGIYTYINNSPNSLDFIYFHVWPNAYSNQNTAFAKQQLGNNSLDFHFAKQADMGALTNLNFTSNGQTLRWEIDSTYVDIVKVFLTKPLSSKAQIVIQTPFTVKVPEVFSRMGHDNGSFYLTQWYPKPAVYDVNGWNQMPYIDQGEFYSEFGNYDVSITLPQNYTVAATGELTTASEIVRIDSLSKKLWLLDPLPSSSPEKKTLNFKANQVHDFAWFASKQFNVKKRTVNSGEKDIDLYIYSKTPLEVHLDYVEQAVKYYGEHVGTYPYPQISVVEGGLKAGGGMEYPMVTICNELGQEVVVHEVGHNWFYGILANNERRYPWMDESINSFYENRTIKGITSSQPKLGRLIRRLKNFQLAMNQSQAIGLHSAEYTKMNYGTVVYMEGAQAFEYLASFLGEETFKEAMKNYFNEWKFKHPLPGDMQVSFEKSTQKDLSWFFDEIINKNLQTDYSLSKKQKQIILENVGQTSAPIPITLYDKGTKITQWYKLSPGPKNAVSLGKLEKAVIDEKNLAFDYQNSNDVSHKKVRFGLLNSNKNKDNYFINVMPLTTWNNYDQWQSGILFHNLSNNNSKLHWYAAPMYSWSGKNITGLFRIANMTPSKKQGSFWLSEIHFKRFSTNELFDYTYNKITPSVTYFLPKKSLRTSPQKTIRLAYDHILFQPNFDIEQARFASKNPNYVTLNRKGFILAQYEVLNDRILNGFRWWVELEQGFAQQNIALSKKDSILGTSGSYVQTFDKYGNKKANFNHTKLSTILNYDLDIGIKNKPLKMRFYGSYFLVTPDYGRFLHRVADNGVQNDYRFDNIVMHQSAKNGLLGNQITNDKAFSKFVGIIGQSNTWLWNFNATLPLPGKLPFSPYLELLSYDGIVKNFESIAPTKVLTQLGLQVSVIPGFFEVYLNLWQTKSLTELMETRNNPIDRFHQRITFMIDLNLVDALKKGRFKKILSM